MGDQEQRTEAPAPARELQSLAPPMQAARACRLAGFLVKEDDDAIYVADPQGTWVIPQDGYEDLEHWPGGDASPDAHVSRGGRPVQLVLREGALIHEIRPWRIRKGGDPVDRTLRRGAMLDVFTLDGADGPLDPRTAMGHRQLARLEEVLGRRLGWDPTRNIDDQVFAAHHPRTASWSCESDGGGS